MSSSSSSNIGDFFSGLKEVVSNRKKQSAVHARPPQQEDLYGTKATVAVTGGSLSGREEEEDLADNALDLSILRLEDDDDNQQIDFRDELSGQALDVYVFALRCILVPICKSWEVSGGTKVTRPLEFIGKVMQNTILLPIMLPMKAGGAVKRLIFKRNAARRDTHSEDKSKGRGTIYERLGVEAPERSDSGLSTMSTNSMTVGPSSSSPLSSSPLASSSSSTTTSSAAASSGAGSGASREGVSSTGSVISSDEQRAMTDGYLISFLQGVFRCPPTQHRRLVAQAMQFRTKHVLMELEKRLAQLDQHPFYTPMAFDDPTDFEEWKVRESGLLRSLLEYVEAEAAKEKDDLQGEVFDGALHVRIVEAHGLDGKGGVLKGPAGKSEKFRSSARASGRGILTSGKGASGSSSTTTNNTTTTSGKAPLSSEGGLVLFRVDDVFENQRRTIASDFSPSHLLATEVAPFSRCSGPRPGSAEEQRFLALASVTLPQEGDPASEPWAWINEWRQERAYGSEVDDEGWEYSTGWGKPFVGARDDSRHYVRRRRWVRTRTPVAVLEQQKLRQAEQEAAERNNPHPTAAAPTPTSTSVLQPRHHGRTTVSAAGLHPNHHGHHLHKPSPLAAGEDGRKRSKDGAGPSSGSGSSEASSDHTNAIYVALTYKDQEATTSFHPDNIDPVWNEEFTFNVAPMATGRKAKDDDHLVRIEMWKRKKLSKEFRGQLKLEREALVSAVELPSDCWYELQKGKRLSKRRKVNGSLRVWYQFAPFEEPDPKTPLPLHHFLYTYLLQQCLEHDSRARYGTGRLVLGEEANASEKPVLSKTSHFLLSEYGIRYGVSDVYQTLVYLETLAERFEPTYQFFREVNAALSKLQRLTRAESAVPLTRFEEETFTRSVKALGDRLLGCLLAYRTQFAFPAGREAFRLCLASFTKISGTPALDELTKGYDDVGLFMRDRLEVEMRVGYEAAARDARESLSVRDYVALCDLLCARVTEDARCHSPYFYQAFTKTVKLPQIASAVYAQALRADVAEVVRDLRARIEASPAGEVPAEAFELYLRCRDLETFFRRQLGSAYNPADLRPLFFPIVMAWIRSTGERLRQWVVAAVAIDRMEPIGEAPGHSSSAVDVFQSCQSAVEFFRELDWPEDPAPEDPQFARDVLSLELAKAVGNSIRLCIRNTELKFAAQYALLTGTGDGGGGGFGGGSAAAGGGGGGGGGMGPGSGEKKGFFAKLASKIDSLGKEERSQDHLHLNNHHHHGAEVNPSLLYFAGPSQPGDPPPIEIACVCLNNVSKMDLWVLDFYHGITGRSADENLSDAPVAEEAAEAASALAISRRLGSHVRGRLKAMISGLADCLRPQVRAALRELLEEAGKAAAIAFKMGVPLADSFSVNQQLLMGPLLSRLDVLHGHLYKEAFRGTLRECWKMVCSEYEHAVLEISKKPPPGQLASFKKVLTPLQDFFHDDGGGLPLTYLKAQVADLDIISTLVVAGSEQLADLYQTLYREEVQKRKAAVLKASEEKDKDFVRGGGDDEQQAQQSQQAQQVQQVQQPERPPIQMRHIIKVLEYRKKDGFAQDFVAQQRQIHSNDEAWARLMGAV